MSVMMEKLRTSVKNVFERDRFVEKYKKAATFKSKLFLQIIVSLAFLLLTIANVFARSYVMLILTASGCAVNILFVLLAKRLNNGNLCALSSIATCSLLFAFFVIYGGNDGFACLWVVLLPFLSMVVMNFRIGLCASAFFQAFLIVVFWTPVREMLLYSYNEQFCLRFPLFFFITFMMGLFLTASLRRSEYNECKQLIELEEMTANARILARTDPLTKLANRRNAYEEFEANYIKEDAPHCIVMGDIDHFKIVNDTYGHEFGDEVLVTFANYAMDILPEDYLKVRWGGEEFLFAANAPMDEVYERIEELRKTVAGHEFQYNGIPIHITITFGIAEYTGKNGLSQAIATADDRLYEGKNATRNCTVRG